MTAPTPDMVHCVRCGQETDRSHAAHSGDGLICQNCELTEALDETWTKASQALLASAVGSVGFATVSFLFDPCFGFTVMAVSAAIGAIAGLSRHPEYKEKLGAKAPLVYGLAALGLLISAAHILLVLLAGVVVAATL